MQESQPTAPLQKVAHWAELLDGAAFSFVYKHARIMKQIMTTQKLSDGTVHKVPQDLQKALTSNSLIRAMWEDLTPLARNEWICWTISVKMAETRKEHVTRVVSELKEGIRRPCCWVGCTHRTDKKLSPSQKFVLGKRPQSKNL